MHYYTAYQLTIQSDTLLHGLKPIAPCKPDITIQRTPCIPAPPAAAKQIRNIYGTENRLWITHQAGQYFIENGNTVLYNVGEDKLPFPLHIFLMGSCFGAILQQRGFIVLHANTVQYPDQGAIAFAGHQGAGKSTTSAWHYNQGAKFIADDISAIKVSEGHAIVTPGFQRLKLWEDSLESLGLLAENPIFHQDGRVKYHITIDDHRFADSPTQLTTLNIIEKKLHQPIKLPSIEAIQQLLTHSYRRGFINAMGKTSSHIRQVMRLAECLTIQQIPRPEQIKIKPIKEKQLSWG